MKKFLLRILLFAVLLAVCCYLYSFLGDGYSDEYYLRVTTPKQSAMIIGVSRAAQGLQPEALNEKLNTVYPGTHIYNFAFSLGLSAYGPVYYKAIQQKLDESAKNSVFILEVTPWSIAAAPPDPNDTSVFEERNRALDQLHFFNLSPNIEYLFKCYANPYVNLLLNKMNSNPFYLLHDDGWLEIKAPMDSAAIKRREEGMIFLYKNDFYPRYKFSSKRLEYLEKTIALLKKHGDVYMVRLPIIPEVKKLETEIMSQFDDTINTVAKKYNLAYFNFMDSAGMFSYVDGVHLDKSSGKRVSEDIEDLVSKHKLASQNKAQ